MGGTECSSCGRPLGMYRPWQGLCARKRSCLAEASPNTTPRVEKQSLDAAQHCRALGLRRLACSQRTPQPPRSRSFTQQMPSTSLLSLLPFFPSLTFTLPPPLCFFARVAQKGAS